MPLSDRTRGWLQLLRPANIITSLADVAAGLAVAGFYTDTSLPWWKALALFVATVGFYGGGIVLNDAFDADLDAEERPERPIPQGIIQRREAYTVGFSLLAAGLLACVVVGVASLIVGVALAAMIVIYDAWAKNYKVGPLAMGSCRALNLALGMSLNTMAFQHYPYLPLVPLVYIAVVTGISKFEVRGGKSPFFWVAAVMFILMPGLISLFTYQAPFQTPFTGVLTGVFAGTLMIAVVAVLREPSPANIRNLVKTGVLSIIIIDGIIASRFASMGNVVSILVLYPISILVGRYLAVT